MKNGPGKKKKIPKENRQYIRSQERKKNKANEKEDKLQEKFTDFIQKNGLQTSDQIFTQTQLHYDSTEKFLSDSNKKILLDEQTNLISYLFTKSIKLNVQERIRQSNYVIDEIKQQIIDHIDIFILAAQSYLQLYGIPYDNLLDMIFKCSQDSSFFTQMKLKDSETLTIYGLGKVNLWILVYQILHELKGKKSASNIKKLDEKILKLITQDLFRATYMLIKLFFTQNLKSDYYLCYELLLEKCTWVKEIGAKSQKILLKELENQNLTDPDFKSFESGRSALKNLLNILSAYQHAVKFLFHFGEDITDLVKQASFLCNSLLMMENRMNALKPPEPPIPKIIEYRDYFDSLSIKLPQGLQLPYMTTFNMVKYFYIAEWQKDIFISKDFTLIEFNQILDALILALKKDDVLDLEKMIVLTQVLAVLGQYKSMSVENHTNIIPRILEILYLACAYIDYSTEKSIVCTTKAILKHIALDIVKDSELAVLLDLKKETRGLLEKDIIKAELSSIKTKAYKETYQTKAQEYEKAMRFCQVESEQQLILYQQECEKWDNILRRQETKNQNELATLKERYKERFDAISKQIEDLKVRHCKINEEVKEKSELEKKLQKELTLMQEDHKRLCQEFDKARLEKEQSITLSHQKVTNELKEQNSKEIQEKQIEFQTMIKNQEIIYRKKEEELKKRLPKVKTKAINGIENFYQDKLLKMQNDHLNNLENINQQILKEQSKLENSVFKEETHIATIHVPPEIEYILQEFENFGINYCIFGGYIRDKLLGLAHNDIDVMVNCTPMQLLQLPTIKKFAKPTGKSNVFKLGSLDLVCRSFQWQYLPTKLKKFDFKINTLTCYKGKVYDLLGCKSQFYPYPNRYLELISPSNECFKENPAFILRLIRLSKKLNMEILPDDYCAIFEFGGLISQLPIGIYTNNLQKLFVNHTAQMYYEYIKSLKLLAIVIPTLPEDYDAHLSSLATLEPFWLHKLNEFSALPENYNGYHVLALFLLMPFLLNNNNLKYVIDNILDKFKGDQVEQKQLSHSIKRLIRGEEGTMGIYDEYKSFDFRLKKQEVAEQEVIDDDIFSFTTNHYIPAFQSRQSQINNKRHAVLRSLNESENSQRLNNFF